jgi:hypothetical protein
MNSRSIRIVPKKGDVKAVEPGVLAHLDDLEGDYELADGIPDFRNWKVTLADGREVGRTGDLIVDTSTMAGKYIEVKVDKEVALGDEDRWVLVPADSVRLDDDEDRVVLDRLPAGGLAGAPLRGNQLPTLEEQRLISRYYEADRPTP